MKKAIQILILTSIVLVAGTNCAWAQTLLYYDDFTTLGQESNNGWKPLQQLGFPITPITTGGGLTYSGYGGSNLGAAALQLSNTYGAIVHAASRELSGASYYASFMINAASASGNDDLIMNFVGSPSVNLQSYGLVMKDISGSLRLGLKVDGISTYAASNYSFGTTYLVVVKYNSTSKVYSLFINPSMVSEPGATLTAAAHTGSAATYISQIQFSQYNSMSAVVDGVRVFSTWTDLALVITPGTLIYSESFPANAFLTSAAYGYQQGQGFNPLEVESPGLNSSFSSGSAVRGNINPGSVFKDFGTNIAAGTVYMSFLVSDAASDPNVSYSNVNFYSQTETAWNYQQGFVLDNGVLSLKFGPNAGNVVNGPTLSGTQLVVLGYNSTSGLYSLFVNPTLNGTVPPTANITTTGTAATTVRGITLINPDESDMAYDEIRVSTVWADVVKSTMLVPEPTAQPTNLALDNDAGSIDVSFTAAVPSPTSYLVVRSQNQPPVFVPVDNNTYSSGAVIGNDRIVSISSALSFHDNTVSQGGKCFYKVYAWNGNASSKDYLQQSPLQGVVTLDPVATPSTLTFSGKSESTVSFTITPAGGNSDGTIVLRRQGATPADDPIDGYNYLTGQVDGLTTVAYVGNGTSFTDTGLSPNTEYIYVTYAYSGASTFINYTNTRDMDSQTTAQVEPTAQPTNLTFGSLNSTTLTLGFDDEVSAFGYLVIRREGASPTGIPVDGQTYNTNDVIGDGTVAYVGTDNANLNIFGLTQGTEYYFDIYSYTQQSGFENYRNASPPLEGQRFTLANEPSHPSVITFSPAQNTSIIGSFSGSATTYIVLRRQGSNPDVDPSDGTGYIMGNPLGSATIVYIGTTAGFTDTGLTPGTTYFYRHFGFNGNGQSANYSNGGSAIGRVTAPANPGANAATSVNSTTFNANWVASPTATGYFIDVSTSPTFAGGFLPGYNSASLPNTITTTVSGTTPGVTYYYRVRASSTNGTSFDSNTITLAAEPSNQPTAIAFSVLTTNAYTVSFTPSASATGYLVLRKSGSSPGDVPVDGTTYTVGTTYGTSFVVANASLTSVPSGGMTPGTVYHYDVYSYSGTGTQINYLLSTPLEGSRSTLATEPTIQANNVTFTNLGQNSLTINWLNGNGTGRLVLGRLSNNAFTDPTDGVNYTANSTLGSGSAIAGSYVVYAGPATSVNVTGLLTASDHYFKVYEYNPATASDPSINYLTSAGASNPGNRFTLAPQPSTQPSALAFSNHATTSHTVSFTSNGSDGYLVLRREGSSPSEVPADGTSYTAGNTLGSSLILSTSSSATLASSGMTIGTEYFYDVIAYFGSGTTVNYLTSTAPLQGSRTTLMSEPTIQTQNVNFTNLAPTSLTVNWSTGNGTGRLVLARQGNNSFTDPTDGINYTASSSFGAGSAISGSFVVHAGAGTSVNVTGLSSEVEYYFKAYDFNPATATDPSINYLTSSNASNPKNRFTLATEPSTQPSALSFSNHATTSHNVSFTGNGSTGYLILRSTTSSPGDVPVDGTSYTAGTTYGSSFVVSTGASTSVPSTGLTAGTVYFYDVIAYNGSGTTVNYLTSTAPLEGSRTTIVSEPGTQATNVTINGLASTSLGFTWTNGNGTGRLVLARLGNSTFTDPVDGINYTANPAFGSGSNIGGSYVVYAGSASSTSVSALTANSDYYFKVYEFSPASSADPSINYLTTAGTGNPANRLTLQTAPASPATGIGFTALLPTSFNTTFTQPGSTGVIVLRKAGSAVGDLPVLGTAYTVGQSIGGSNVVYVGSAGSFANTSLIAGVTYHFAIFAYNGSGAATNYLLGSPLIGSQMAVPNFPALSAATSVQQTSFQANWSASTSATSYRLDVATDAGFVSHVSGYSNLNVANVTTYTVNTNLTGGTTYYYRVRAVNAGGASPDNSTPISLLTIPGTPTTTAATAITTTSFTANWSTSVSTTQYRLDVATDAGFVSMVSGYSDLAVGTVTSYSVNTNLLPGTTYHYRVRASNGSGLSGNSGTTSLTTLPSAPASLTATSVGQTSFTANWTAPVGATGYRLDVATDNTFINLVTGYEDLNVGNVTTYSVNTNLTSGTVFYYRLRAVTSGGPSANSNTTSQITVPAAPVIAAGSSITTASFLANWGASTGAASYRLDVSTDNFATFLAGFSDLTVAGTSQSVTGLLEGVTYSYRVRAANSAGTSGNSGTESVLTVPPVPTAEPATAITTNSFTAHWTATDGATSYLLDISSDNFATFLSGYQGKVLGAISENVAGLTPNTAYQYRVKATSASGTSANSNVVSLFSYSTAPVATSATALAQLAFTANWNAIPGITEFRLDVSTDDFTTNLIGFDNLVVTGTSKVVGGLSAGTNYKFRLRATNGAGPSANSNIISTVTIPATPIANAATSISTTGFTASWSAVTGQTNYVLDISTDDFATFITDYDGKSLTSSSEVVTGLTPNTAYKYRVRSINASGQSPNSSSISILTYSAAPGVPNVTAIGQYGFTVNWIGIAGVTEFRLDVSTDDFATMTTGFADLAVTGTSKAVTGLQAGTDYKFRLRAVNATGASANSSSFSVLTLPGTPQSSDETAVSVSAFTINWSTVQSATSYLLDVSRDSDFTNMLTAYNARSVTGTSQAVTALTPPGTTFYYRIRAKNATGESPNSEMASQVTVPGKPVMNNAFQVSATQFSASWSPVDGAESYELDVYSSATGNFTTVAFVNGFQARFVQDATEEIVNGLTPQTVYRVRVRARNEGGLSVNSDYKIQETLKQDGSALVQLGIVTGVPTPSSVKATIAGGTGPYQVSFYHKKITEAAFTAEAAVSSATTSIDVPIQGAHLDEIGMEYKFKVVDFAERESETGISRIFVEFTSVASSPKVIEAENYAGTRASMRIIAVPYILNETRISEIFKSLGEYNKKTWRMAHYENGTNREVGGAFGADITDIQRGLGYWFNAKGEVRDILMGTGKSGTDQSFDQFPLVLIKGWNQIGNPFPFAIDWSDVKADNPTATGLGKLRTFKGELGSFADEDKLDPFTGGFVFAENGVTVNLKVALKNTAGGRIMSPNLNIGEESWRLPLTLSSGPITYGIGGVGMEPTATVSRDQWDEMRLPRLEEYLDITFHHPESEFPNFTMDVVSTTKEHTWKFVAGSDSEGESTLSWNNAAFGDNDAQIYLLDVEGIEFINMREAASYSFTNKGKREFRIYYRNDGQEIAPDLFLMGQPYPNPFSENISLIVALPNSQEAYTTELIAYDMMGKPIRTITKMLSPGVHELTWDGDDANGGRSRGVYILRARANEQWFGSSHRVVLK